VTTAEFFFLKLSRSGITHPRMSVLILSSLLGAATLAAASAAGVVNAVCQANVGQTQIGINMDVGPGNPPVPLPANTPLCRPYANQTLGSCCNVNLPNTLSTVGPGALYQNYTFDMCPGRTMSAECRAYMNAQECSFACDPLLTAAYANSATVQVCSNYCNGWFDACANDYACVTDWQAWPYDANYGYICPQGSTCQTFAQRYQNGQGLCNTMWGSVYNYSTNLAACVSLSNPKVPTPTPSPKSGASSSAVAAAALVAALVATVAAAAAS